MNVKAVYQQIHIWWRRLLRKFPLNDNITLYLHLDLVWLDQHDDRVVGDLIKCSDESWVTSDLSPLTKGLVSSRGLASTGRGGPSDPDGEDILQFFGDGSQGGHERFATPEVAEEEALKDLTVVDGHTSTSDGLFRGRIVLDRRVVHVQDVGHKEGSCLKTILRVGFHTKML